MASKADEILTIAEIYSRFDGEWVVLLDSVVNEFDEVIAGRVRCHDTDRELLHLKIEALRPQDFAVIFAGSIVEDDGIVDIVSIWDIEDQ